MSEEKPKVRKTWKPTEEPVAPTETVDSLKAKISESLARAPLFDANASAKDITDFTAKYDGFIATLKRLSE